MDRSLALPTIAALIIGVGTPRSGLTQTPPADSTQALIGDLLSSNRDRVARAVARLPVHPDDSLGWAFPEGREVGAQLVEALAIALERENRLLQNEGSEVSPHPELALNLLHVVIATKDSSTTGVLVQMLWTGAGARRALLSFGSGVLHEVLDLTQSPEATSDQVSGALLALQDAIVQWGPELDAQVRGRMREVVVMHLEGPPVNFASARERQWVFSRAVDLAEALEDPELVALARRLTRPRGCE